MLTCKIFHTWNLGNIRRELLNCNKIHYISLILTPMNPLASITLMKRCDMKLEKQRNCSGSITSQTTAWNSHKYINGARSWWRVFKVSSRISERYSVQYIRVSRLPFQQGNTVQYFKRGGSILHISRWYWTSCSRSTLQEKQLSYSYSPRNVRKFWKDISNNIAYLCIQRIQIYKTDVRNREKHISNNVA